MDYDQSAIPSVYDEARRLAPERLQQWLDLISRDAPPPPGSVIVDLGCGTGRFSEALAEHFDARVIGVDPSQKMLDVARQKLGSGRVELLRASAHSLPLADRSVDIVFMSMVFHHLDDPAAAAKECRRLLRKGGRLCVRNTTREAEFPHRRFFPAMHALIDTELPPRSFVRDVVESAGFSLVVHEVVTQVVASSWGSFVYKSSLRADSFLARLTDETFEAGMAELRAHAEKATSDQPVVEELDWYVFRSNT